jgi:hypothetical protein
MSSEVAPVFEGEMNLKVFDFVSVWRWARGMLVPVPYLLLGANLWMNYAGPYRWIFGLMPFTFLGFLALGVLGLVSEIIGVNRRGKSTLTIQIF